LQQEGRDSGILRLSIPVRSERAGSAIAMGLLAFAVIWAAALPWAAWRIASPSPGAGRSLAAMIYVAGASICHQRPERSFKLAGVTWPVCGRCSGLYLSAGVMALLGLAIRIRSLPAPASNAWRVTLVLAAVPTLGSWAIERLGLVNPGNLVRAICAIPLGAAVAAALEAVRRQKPRDT